MTGEYSIRIKNRDVDFRFTVRRNITIVRGYSATGKTTLYDMVVALTQNGPESGVQLSCDKPCVALIHADMQTQITQLKNIRDSIVFVDEGDRLVVRKEFAETIRKTDNYYVLFIRDNLHDLPYSVEEIYEIRKSGKYHRFVNYYSKSDGYVYGRQGRKFQFDTILTEDSKSGYQFFDSFCKDTDWRCESAKSKTQIYKWIKDHPAERVFIVADGAAFGPEMNRVMELVERNGNKAVICLPESFEWMILKSGVVKSDDLNEVMAAPGKYIDSREYFSWEQFFTKYLIRITKDSQYSKYSKSRLAQYYMLEKNSGDIAAVIMLEK